jgi:hypothetical protein
MLFKELDIRISENVTEVITEKANAYSATLIKGGKDESIYRSESPVQDF